MEFEKLSIKKKRFIELLVNKNSKKAVEIAKEIGISAHTYYKWEKDPELLKIAYNEHLKRLGAWLPKVLIALAEKAEEGDVRAIKLLLEQFNVYKDDKSMSGKLTPDRIIEIVRNTVDEEEKDNGK